MTCRYTGRTTPRIVVGRHIEDCPGRCDGCQPCTRAHCRVCGIVHAAGTCPGCLDETREALDDIARMCAALPAEVAHRGVDTEAMNLLGPIADPEAWQHHAASAMAGRIVLADCEARDVEELRTWLIQADHELHPLWVLGTWEMAVRDALEHETDQVATGPRAASYLGLNLTYLAAYEHLPFEDMARDLRRCRSHIERVLHDGEQVETGAPCMRCDVPQVRIRGERDDRWQCPRCKRESTEDQYRLAVKGLHAANSPWLAAEDITVLTGIKAPALRKRASRGDVSSRLEAGRVVYRAEDIPEVVAKREQQAS